MANFGTTYEVPALLHIPYLKVGTGVLSTLV